MRNRAQRAPNVGPNTNRISPPKKDRTQTEHYRTLDVKEMRSVGYSLPFGESTTEHSLSPQSEGYRLDTLSHCVL